MHIKNALKTAALAHTRNLSGMCAGILQHESYALVASDMAN